MTKAIIETGVFDKVSKTKKIRTIPTILHTEQFKGNQILKKASL